VKNSGGRINVDDDEDDDFSLLRGGGQHEMLAQTRRFLFVGSRLGLARRIELLRLERSIWVAILWSVLVFRMTMTNLRWLVPREVDGEQQGDDFFFSDAYAILLQQVG
jgi:hypothetical protein